MTAPPQPRVQNRVPNVRDSFIVANVGMGTFIAAGANLPPAATSKVEVES
jgi:hypothetical protein